MIITWNDDNLDHVWIPHTVGEELDYTANFAEQLAEDGGDTIDTTKTVITKHAALTQVRTSQTSTAVTAWFTGGIAGEDLWFKVHVETFGQRKYDKTLWLRCAA
jgi:hypothetical protein